MLMKEEAAAMLRAGHAAAMERVNSGVAEVSLGSVVNAASNATQAALPQPLRDRIAPLAGMPTVAERFAHMDTRLKILKDVSALCNLIHDKLHVALASEPPKEWDAVVKAFGDDLDALLDAHWTEG